MANAERQMPEHVEAAYRDAVENILFLKKAAVAGDQLCSTSICGYFRNLSSLLQPD
jgi:hypothetical protein